MRRRISPEVEKALRGLSAQVWYKPYYPADEPEVLWRKGLRYTATIIRAACELQLIEQSEGEFREIYDQLGRKVKILVRKRCHDVGEDTGPARVFWPCEILDLKEVQDEVKVLTGGDLLDKDNPKDREIVKQAIEETGVDEWINIFNTCIRKLGIMLAKATEIHRKHPEERFWFFTTLF